MTQPSRVEQRTKANSISTSSVWNLRVRREETATRAMQAIAEKTQAVVTMTRTMEPWSLGEEAEKGASTPDIAMKRRVEFASSSASRAKETSVEGVGW